MINRQFTKGAAIVLSTLFCLSTFAQTVAITGATVHTGENRLENATILISRGYFQAVGTDISIPAEAERIDATGKIITAGLFDAETQLGIRQIESVDSTSDQSTTADSKLSAALDIAPAINPHSSFIPINRIEGVTRAIVAPLAGWDVFAGQAALIQLGTQGPTLTKSKVALLATLGEKAGKFRGGSRAAALIRLRAGFSEAAEYQRRESGALRPLLDYEYSRADLAAIAEAKRNKTPLIVAANRESDIRGVISLKAELGIPVILLDGREAWQLADELAAAKIPVIINPLDNLPLSFDYLGARLDNATRLHRAGVVIAFTDEESGNARRIRQLAGNAVAHGLPWEAALAAITSAPAEILGIGDQVGKIKAGYEADVVIWSGDPLEVTHYAEQVMIQGRWQPMESRQTQLRDRYLNANNSTMPHAYR